MTSKLRIATWNLCLGLSNKKNIVKQYMKFNNIDVCCMQEVDLLVNHPTELLSFPGYNLETETNNLKIRVGVYVNERIKYRRRSDLEGTNSHIVILDIEGHKNLRIISIYRTFKPQENITAREKFNYQLNLIKIALTPESILLGDFNIDDAKRFEVNYTNRNLFCDFEEKLSYFGLFQHINFATWSRLIGGDLKSSILDHIYSNNPTSVTETSSITPAFGDHLLIYIDYALKSDPIVPTYKRDWRRYSKELLNIELGKIDWNINVSCVQEYWNVFENKLINVIDAIAPYSVFVNNVALDSKPPKNFLTMQNIRKKNS